MDAGLVVVRDDLRGAAARADREPDAGLRSQASWTIPPRESRTLPLYVDVDRKSFVNGERTIHMRIDDDHGFEEILAVTLLGPAVNP